MAVGAPQVEDAAAGGESVVLNKRTQQAATRKHCEGFPIVNILAGANLYTWQNTKSEGWPEPLGMGR